VREIQAGSGYWSQNSAVAVLGLNGSPTQLEVRWPGAKTFTHHPLTKEARQIEVDWQLQSDLKPPR
jgi:hypothetical protein